MRLEKMIELSELSREIATKEYNLSRRDEILLVDYKASLQADISKALEEKRQCAQIIQCAEFGMNRYLHDAYSEAATTYQNLMNEWEQRFPGEMSMRVAVPVPAEGFP